MGEAKDKKSITAKTAKLKSHVYVHDTGPHDRPTSGIIMTKDQAIELAAKLLAVAQAENANGLIYVTGHHKDKRVTILREKNARKKQG